MKDWKEIYKSLLTSAEEAIRSMRSGDRVVSGHAGGSPEKLPKALVDNRDAYENVEIVQMTMLGNAEYCRPEAFGHFINNSLFVGGSTRKAIYDGRAEYTPFHLIQILHLFSVMVLPVDIALCMVSPSDNKGYCSRNEYIVSISSALQVYLSGLVASESIVYRQLNFSGRQADLIRRASWSKEGAPSSPFTLPCRVATCHA